MSEQIPIDAERIGLAATATPKEIAERVHSIPAIEAERDKWKLKAHELASQNVELKKKVDANEQAAAELAVERVFASKRLDSKLKPVALETYKQSPKLFQQWADAMEDKTFLEKTASLRGIEAGPTDPDVELESRVAELMAKEEAFKGKRGTAMTEVLKRDPELSKRYREKHVVGAKGGQE